MELQDVIRRRRMVRSFEDRPIPAELVDRILHNATRAPSAGFIQGYAFVALEGPEQTDEFWRICHRGMVPSNREGVGAANLVVIPLAHKQAYLDRYSKPDKTRHGNRMDLEENWPVAYWDIDTAMASMNILLTCVDAGLGALFFGIFFGEKELLEYLGVPEGFKPIGAIAIGWPAEEGDPGGSPRSIARRDRSEMIHRGRWGGGS